MAYGDAKVLLVALRDMLRYAGENLGTSPHIVVLGSCKVGNLIVAIPMLEGLRNRFPSAVIGFIGSTITSDLEAALPFIDWRLSWDEQGREALHRLSEEITQRLSQHGSIDLAVNLDGFNSVTQVLSSFIAPKYIAGNSLNANRHGFVEWGDHPWQRFLSDPDWDSAEFIARYSGFFHSNYIAELFAALAWVHEYCNPASIKMPLEEPPFSVPDVLIHCTTARAAKIWPFSYWKVVIDGLRAQSLSVGLIGSAPSCQQRSYNSGEGEDFLLATTDVQDLRGRTNLLQLAGACAKSRAVISVDAGPLHIAAAVGTPTFAIVGNDANGVGASPIRLWLPRSPNVVRATSTVTCRLCEQSRFINDGCLAEEHFCMLSVGPEQVLNWIRGVLSN